MKRPKPTKQLFIELCGGNRGLIESIHHGLLETPLDAFYPHLDLDEILAFEASSWKTREKDAETFSDFVKSAEIYDIFSKVYEIGSPWLNKHKNISEKLVERYAKLNPFGSKNLKLRLGGVKVEDVESLKKKLQEGVNKYVFACQYQEAKRMGDGDNYKLAIMNFQNVYPKSGKIVPAFASENARIVSGYPTNYESLSF